MKLFILLIASFTFSEKGDLRTWESTAGTKSKASLVGVQLDGKNISHIHLEKDGKTLELPAGKLNRSARLYVKSVAPKMYLQTFRERQKEQGMANDIGARDMKAWNRQLDTMTDRDMGRDLRRQYDERMDRMEEWQRRYIVLKASREILEYRYVNTNKTPAEWVRGGLSKALPEIEFIERCEHIRTLPKIEEWEPNDMNYLLYFMKRKLGRRGLQETRALLLEITKGELDIAHMEGYDLALKLNFGLQQGLK